ncbi:hypothetical protein ABZY19_21985 [Streptomyces sp. NPDC006475]|uniref:hypothetical protein n=1 Tax=Streptomyces sp. NPDC006475 TaxID=3155719 RepID=UPI0033A1F420
MRSAAHGTETVIDADSSVTETVDCIMIGTGLAGLPALELGQSGTPGAEARGPVVHFD